MVLETKPVAAPRNPVPNKASTITWDFATSGQTRSQAEASVISTISFVSFSHRSRFAAASPRRSSRFANRQTRGFKPSSFNRRAATRPSPPLFPLPQSTVTRCDSLGENLRKIASATCFPAASINWRMGMPKRSVVSRSTSRISAAVKAFMENSRRDQSIQPPLTLTTCPVTYSASSEAKKATAAPTSSTVGGRPMGKRASRILRASSRVSSF